MADYDLNISKGIDGLNDTDIGLNLDVVTKTEADWYLLYSGKGVGKSWAVRERVLNKFLKYGDEFVIVRRRDIETKPANIRKYFEKVDVAKITNDKYQCIDVNSNEIFLCTIDAKMKKHREKRIGHVIPQAQFNYWKGADFPLVTSIINEEFISETANYLPDESSTFMKLINTVFRPLTKAEYDLMNDFEKARYNRREVWLVGNTISRQCPYFRDYNLQNILKQEANTIDIYEYRYPEEIDEITGQPKLIRLACWYIGENVKGKKKSHGFVFGKAYDTIVKGTWQMDIYPKLQYSYDEYKKLYEFLVLDDMNYCVQLLKHKEGYALYIYPWTSKRDTIKRKITKAFSMSQYVSNVLYSNIPVEAFIIELLMLNKCCYSDNLTGTEFQKYRISITRGLC